MAEFTINACDTESNENWIKSARLKRLAKNGDKEAQAELDRMENIEMEFVSVDDSN